MNCPEITRRKQGGGTTTIPERGCPSRSSLACSNVFRLAPHPPGETGLLRLGQPRSGFSAVCAPSRG